MIFNFCLCSFFFKFILHKGTYPSSLYKLDLKSIPCVLVSFFNLNILSYVEEVGTSQKLLVSTLFFIPFFLSLLSIFLHYFLKVGGIVLKASSSCRLYSSMPLIEISVIFASEIKYSDGLSVLSTTSTFSHLFFPNI